MITIETIRRGRRTWTLVAGEPVLRDLLGRPEDAPTRDSGGRGAVGVLTLGPGRRGILRHLRHGGMFRWLGDLFAGPSRSLKEFFLLLKARERGAPVPRVLAAGTERILGVFYRADLVTEEIPSRTLGDLLGSGDPGDLKPLLRLLLDLHRSGVEHVDLNIENILVPADGGSWVAIDLDGGRLYRVLDLERRLQSLLRLDRSYDKRFAEEGPLSFQRRYRIWHHYLLHVGIPPRSLLPRLRRERAARRWRRWRWRLGGSWPS